MATIIPPSYTQQLDPLGAALGRGFGQGINLALVMRDLQALGKMGQTQDIYNTMYGARGLQAPQAQMPNLYSPMGLLMMMQGKMQNLFPPIMTPLQKAQSEYYRARAEEARQPKKTEMQKLIEEGYTPQKSKLVRDIFHGLEPRASATKILEQKPMPEQLSFWQTVYNKTLDPEWGGTRPTEDMDAARELAKQKIDRITATIRQSVQANKNEQGRLEADLENAISAMERGAHPKKVYERLIKAYPDRAREIRKALGM